MTKISNTLATEVKLNTVSATSSLKSLNNAIKATTNAWKANETSLKSAGDNLKASEAKYKGISSTIEVVQTKIDKLKEKQESLDTSTKKGSEQYAKLSTQLAQAENKLASLTSQQSRAKSSMEYYKSGLGDLQRSFKSVNAVTNSYVERLRAEGKEAEAQKAKLGGLKDSVANLGKQYKVQSDELDRIKTASGATSDAYKRQQVRVNETATAMAKAKTSQNELLKAMEKEPHGFMHGVRSKLDSIDDKAKKTSHLFGTILGAHLVANGVTNALSSLTASFGELTSAVTAYDNKQRTMTATWTTLTGSNGKGKQMVGIGNELASAFNQNINVVDELNQSFYHVFDNAPRTKELTKSILTLGDTLNLSDENVTRLGTNFTHMLSSGKMQLGDFNMINDQLPMYAGKMLEFERKQQHNSKLTMSTLRDQMSAGKISAKDAEQVMNSLGGKYAKASENLMKTIPGMERSIRTQMPALLDAVYKPIANMKSPLMGQFTKWIGDKNTKSEFKDVGNALALQINDITKAFAGKNFNVGNTLDKMLANLAKDINKVGANIVAHKKEIKSFFSSMKTASKTSFNVFVQSLKDIEPILKIVGGFAEKHPKVFAGLASSAFVASKGISALKLAFSGLDLAKGLGGKLSRIVFKPKVDGAGGKRELTKFASFVKRSGTRMGHWLKMAASVTTTKAKGALSSMWTHTKSVGGKIGKGLKWTAKIAYKGASKAFSVLAAGIKILGKSFLSLGRLLLLNPIGLVLTAVVALGAAFYEAYKHIKPFREAVNGIASAIGKWAKGAFKTAGKAISSFGKTVKGVVKGIGEFFTGKLGWEEAIEKAIGKMTKGAEKAFKPVTNVFKAFVSGVKKVFSGFAKVLEIILVAPIALEVGLAIIAWKKIKKPVISVVDAIKSGVSKGFKAVKKVVATVWDDLVSLTKTAWKLVRKYVVNPVASVYKAVEKYIVKLVVKAITNTWNKLKTLTHDAWLIVRKYVVNPIEYIWKIVNKYIVKAIVKYISDTWDKLKDLTHDAWLLIRKYTVNPIESAYKTVSKWISKLLNTIQSVLGSIKSVWSNIWGSIASTFKSVWKNIKNIASDGINDVISILNTGIGGIDSVIHAFGGKKKAISTISKVHLATGTGVLSGTRKAITKPTLAVLNDGNDSPETGNKEAVFLPDGRSGIVQGRNTKAMLPAGTEVLNASETKLFMGMQGVTHYAKGSNNWFGNIMSGIGSGIGDVSGWLVKKTAGLKKFFTTAEKIIAHPIKSLDSMFNYTKAGAGVVADITKGMFNDVKKQAGNWWSSLWSSIDLSGGSAGGNWRHNPGLNETNGFGAYRKGGSHDGVDFSGPLGSAILAVHGGTVTRTGKPVWDYAALGDVITVKSSDGWQEIYQEFGGLNNIKVAVGDQIKTGQKIATLGRLNGAGTGSHVHIGVSHGSLWNHGGSNTNGWYDVTKMHGSSDGSNKNKKSPVIKGIKSQVGSGFFKFMNKLAGLFGDNSTNSNGTSAAPTGSHRHWMQQAGIPKSWWSAINEIVTAESSWQTSAHNGQYYGLPQTTVGNLAKAGSDWRTNPITQLKAMMMYIKGRYGNADKALSFRHAHNWYANGGISRVAQLAHISEGNKTESIIPWDISKRGQAYQIMDTTLKNFAKTDGTASGTTTSTTDISALVDQGKQMIALLASLLTGQSNPTPAVVSANDVYNGYNKIKKTKTTLSKLGKGYMNGI